MTTFFTSDTHFGHAGLIKHGYRAGFASVEDMDEALIAAWNARVSPRDVVWHLGDFTLAGAEPASRVLDRLNGTIHLIWGNHDRNAVRRLARWASSQPVAHIKADGQRMTLCHFAWRVWPDAKHGALMLHGHSHGGLTPNRRSLDVGVDCWPGFAPVTVPEILARMATLPPPVIEDHHGPEAA